MKTMRLVLLLAVLGITACSAVGSSTGPGGVPWPSRPPADETPCQGPIHIC